MARVSLFGRQLAISIVITSIFVLSLGFLSVQMVRQSRREAAPYLSPAATFAKFLHEIPKDKRLEVLKKAGSEGGEPASHFQFWLLDNNENVLFPQGESLPVRPYSKVQIDENDPSQFLLVKTQSRSNSRQAFLTNLAFLVVAVILGTTLSLMILFYSLRKKAKLADSVISDLQRGNLKARFPVTKMDEVGEAMLRFNKMADEIERLVERLKTTEKARMSILQELAHDLRTPVSSLKNMLETISSRDATMPSDVKQEFLALSLKEVDYFEHLVEDLLFLARATEPRYHHSAETVNLVELIENEIESVKKSSLGGGTTLSFVRNFSGEVKNLKGDAHLLKRLFRNALDNAASFAKKEVHIILNSNDKNFVECIVTDDGPGFTEQTIKEFGHRKISRQFNSSSQRRASIGLGSVIMTTVASLHRGEVLPANLRDSSGKILGAEVRITLPKE